MTENGIEYSRNGIGTKSPVGFLDGNARESQLIAFHAHSPFTMRPKWNCARFQRHSRHEMRTKCANPGSETAFPGAKCIERDPDTPLLTHFPRSGHRNVSEADPKRAEGGSGEWT